MEITFELKGGDAFEAKLKLLGSAAVKAAAKSLYRSAGQVMTLSKDQYVPVKTGALRGSGDVALPEIEGNNVLVQLGYGGPAIDYAVVVHENLQAYHKPPTQAKYLETPLTQAIPQINQNLADDLNEGLGAA